MKGNWWWSVQRSRFLSVQRYHRTYSSGKIRLGSYWLRKIGIDMIAFRRARIDIRLRIVSMRIGNRRMRIWCRLANRQKMLSDTVCNDLEWSWVRNEKGISESWISRVTTWYFGWTGCLSWDPWRRIGERCRWHLRRRVVQWWNWRCTRRAAVNLCSEKQIQKGR